MHAILVSYDVIGRIEPATIELRLAELETAGLTVHHHQAHHGQSPLILFFDSPGAELSARLRSASADGCRRLLAVALRDLPEDSDVWPLLECGASDVIAWSRSGSAALEISARLRRWQAVDDLMHLPMVRTNLVGRSPAWRAALRQAVEVAHFTDASVLILGESGTGKELIARLIHAVDARPGKREMVVLDCTTVVPELSGSEFFGHERGAFTGAALPREGAFALADGGTLFLDEIGDLPLPLQAQLLRAVQERTYKPVGGNVWRSTRFRLVCATHRPLAQEVAAGSFRADLYYRIGGVVCRVPPLRERPEDIVPLFQHFVARQLDRADAPEIDEAVRRWLLRRPYPGNVRELQQLARRVACRHVGIGPITIGHIPDDERPCRDSQGSDRGSLELAIRQELAHGAGLKDISRAAAEAAIRVALDEANGSLQLAARRLRVTDRALQLRRAGDPSARQQKVSA